MGWDGQNLVPVLLVAGFFGWRFWSFRRARARLPTLLGAGALLVDVRSAEEFRAGHNPRSINVPLESLSAESKRWEKAKPVVLCCASGTRSGLAAALLRKEGFSSVLNAGPWTNTIGKEG